MAAARCSTLLAVLLALAVPACGGRLAASGAAARVPLAPPGVFVDEDVADGFVAYKAALASSGRWDGDPNYGVHWCPARSAADSPFRPYVSNGHWSTTDRAAYGSPPGTVYWKSDDAQPWAEITMHRGWWIDLGAQQWCWVPGLRETPARVVWRDGDDFVGWAPEPPAWVDDGDESPSADFEWCFELLGTLLEDVLDSNVLAGDAAQTAAQATAPSRHSGGAGPAFSRHAPAKPVVDAARTQLVAYVHSRTSDSPPAAVGAPGHSASPSTASTSSSSSSTPGAEPSDTKADLAVDRLPPAGMLVTMMMNDPVVGPAGVARFAPSDRTGAGTGAGYDGSPSARNAAAVAVQSRRAKAESSYAPSRATRSGTYHTTSHGSSSSGSSRSSSGSSSHHK